MEENRKKRKSNNNPQDILTVMAVFAIIALVCVACAFIQRNPEILTGGSAINRASKEYEQAKRISQAVTVAIGVIGLVIVGLFIKSMVKRKRLEAKKRREREQKLWELEEARRRVEEAKRNQFLTANKNELNKRRGSYSREEKEEKANAMRHYSLSDYMDDDEFEREYERRRKRLAEYRYSDDEDDLYGDFDEEDEPSGIFARIKEFFRSLFGKLFNRKE